MSLRDELTPVQFEKVGLLALGYSLKQIAVVMGLSEMATRMRFREMYERTGTSDKLELAVRFAREIFMGYDSGSAGSSTGQSNSFLKNRLRVRVPSRAPVTPVIFPANLYGPKLNPEDICEHF